MWGYKPFTSVGAMSPRMKALAISQNKIVWRNFMEGCISTHFYVIQHYHLALSGSYLNGSDWTKTLISTLAARGLEEPRNSQELLIESVGPVFLFCVLCEF
jgi:hypothetical protein